MYVRNVAEHWHMENETTIHMVQKGALVGQLHEPGGVSARFQLFP